MEADQGNGPPEAYRNPRDVHTGRESEGEVRPPVEGSRRVDLPAKNDRMGGGLGGIERDSGHRGFVSQRAATATATYLASCPYREWIMWVLADTGMWTLMATHPSRSAQSGWGRR